MSCRPARFYVLPLTGSYQRRCIVFLLVIIIYARLFLFFRRSPGEALSDPDDNTAPVELSSLEDPPLAPSPDPPTPTNYALSWDAAAGHHQQNGSRKESKDSDVTLVEAGLLTKWPLSGKEDSAADGVITKPSSGTPLSLRSIPQFKPIHWQAIQAIPPVTTFPPASPRTQTPNNASAENGAGRRWVEPDLPAWAEENGSIASPPPSPVHSFGMPKTTESAVDPIASRPALSRTLSNRLLAPLGLTRTGSTTAASSPATPSTPINSRVSPFGRLFTSPAPVIPSGEEIMAQGERARQRASVQCNRGTPEDDEVMDFNDALTSVKHAGASTMSSATNSPHPGRRRLSGQEMNKRASKLMLLYPAAVRSARLGCFLHGEWSGP